MGEYVDQKTMFAAGYASGYRPSLKPFQNEMIDKVFGWVGKQAVSHYQTAFKELGELKQKSNSATAAVDMQIDLIGDELNPQIQSALDIFKKEYDKGARCVKLSWSAKKKAGCQTAMDTAMMKMTKLNEHLGSLQVKRKEEQERALLMNGDTGHDDGKVKLYNSGSHSNELAYSTMLANGTLLNHMEVNLKTGELQLMEEVGTGKYKVIPGQHTERTDVSDSVPSSAGDYSGGFGGQEIPTLPGQEESTIETQGQEGEMVTKDPGQYEQDREEIMEIVPTKLQDIRFAPAEDDSLQDIQRSIMEKNYNEGMDGGKGERDDIMNSLNLDAIRGHVSDASNDAIKSYFFGGTLVDGTKTKLPESAPVYQYLLGMGLEPGTAEWNGALESLKYEDFGKGSEMREHISQFMFEKATQFYDNGYNKYLNSKEVEAKSKGGGGKEEPTLTVDGERYTDRADARIKAKNMLNKGVEFSLSGQWKFVQDGKGNSTRYRQIEDANGNITWKNEGTTSVNEMLKFRGLGDLGYSFKEQEEPSDEDVVQQYLDVSDPRNAGYDSNNDGIPDAAQPELFNR